MSKDMLVGFDIGGTKCSVAIGKAPDQPIATHVVPTLTRLGPREFFDSLVDSSIEMLREHGSAPDEVLGAGVVCGGPVDEPAGMVLGPPNLPGWDRIDVLKPLRRLLGPQAQLVNDANASAMAEWRFGAGKGMDSLVFLTFGTGMGAGLVLDGRPYNGARSAAGEVGRIPMEKEFPGVGSIRGTFEGLCSGGGIARLASRLVNDAVYPKDLVFGSRSEESTRSVFLTAREGAAGARAVVEFSGRVLAAGLRIIVDVLDPELIVLGSVFVRSGDLLGPILAHEFQSSPEDLCCQGIPVRAAGLGERLGDVASLMVAQSAGALSG